MRLGASALLAVAEPERVRRLREETGQWRGWFPGALAAPSVERELESSERVVDWSALNEVRLTVEVELWMMHPGEPFGYDHPDGEEIVALCGACWNFGVLQALAHGPLSRELLIEACGAPNADDDPDERAIAARLVDNLLEVGLLELGLEDDETRGLVIWPSGWLIRAVCPLLVATRIEAESDEAEGDSLEALDWATLLLTVARAVPVVSWPGSGAVRLVCELGEEHFPDKAVVTVTVEEGEIVEAVLGDRADSSAGEAVGTGDDWCRALIDLRPTSLEYRGAEGGRELIESFGATLFGHARDSAWSAPK